MTDRSKMTIVTPVYTANREGYSEKFLVQYFYFLMGQTFKDFDIVISDHSVGDNLKVICDVFSHVLNIKYYKNDHKRGSIAANVNFGLRKATGEIVKILFMDDFFFEKTGLQETWDAFQMYPNKKWLIAGCIETDEDVTEFFNGRLASFNNLFPGGWNDPGNPSTYSIRQEYIIEMDENLNFVVDEEFFYRSYWHYGYPIVMEKIVHCFRNHRESTFHRLKDDHNLIRNETEYFIQKFREIEKERVRNKLVNIFRYKNRIYKNRV